LKLVTPEEEKAISKNKNDPPVNALIGELEELDIGGTCKKIVVPDATNPSVVTKDDKAPIRPECWDTFLYLGLSVHAQGGPWTRAARTIRPLLARHWRRM
jgi:hypothetical protein